MSENMLRTKIKEALRSIDEGAKTPHEVAGVEVVGDDRIFMVVSLSPVPMSLGIIPRLDLVSKTSVKVNWELWMEPMDAVKALKQVLQKRLDQAPPPQSTAIDTDGWGFPDSAYGD